MFFTWPILAQKTITKEIAKPEHFELFLDASNCYEAKIETSNSGLLEVSAQIEGEYEPDLTLNIEEEAHRVKIHPRFFSGFVKPNDKLSAHKVVSISLLVKVPEFSNVQLIGDYTDVKAQGKFKGLKVVLDSGTCELTHVTGKALIMTTSGNISVGDANGHVSANSKFGHVVVEEKKPGDSNYILQSVRGNIVVNPD